MITWCTPPRHSPVEEEYLAINRCCVDGWGHCTATLLHWGSQWNVTSTFTPLVRTLSTTCPNSPGLFQFAPCSSFSASCRSVSQNFNCSSQPSIVHWLSSPIFPCLVGCSFVPPWWHLTKSHFYLPHDPKPLHFLKAYDNSYSKMN